jgi:hypothetical protein
MNRASADTYNGGMALARGAAALLFAFAVAAASGQARADDVAIGPTPIVNVQLLYGHVAFTVWNRPIVRITTDGSVTWQRSSVIPANVTQINMWAEQTSTARGSVTLPQETFILPPIAGPREALVVRGYGQTTIQMPQETTLVVAHVLGEGGIGVFGYQGTFVGATHNGALFVRNFTGTAFLQALRGRIVAIDSTFDRVRARAGAGPVIFSACSAGQIDATSVTGAVLYDNGTLGQGPVHFSSEYANVGVGIASLPGATTQSVRGTATVSLGAAGPVVTAISMHGTAIIYRGALASHPELLARWPRIAPLFRIAPFMRRPPLRPPGRPSIRRPPR